MCAVFWIMPTGLVVPICVLTVVCVVSLSVCLSMSLLVNSPVLSQTTTQLSSITLKEQQCATTEHLYNKDDMFAWPPTGFGKSICFQVLPFFLDRKHGKCNHERGIDLWWFCCLPWFHNTALLISQLTSLGCLSLCMHMQCILGSLFSSPTQLAECLGTRLETYM